MIIDETFIYFIDMIDKSSKYAKDTANHLASNGLQNSLDQPLHMFENESIISKISNDSIILKDNIFKEISKLKNTSNIKEYITKNLGSILGITFSITLSYFFVKLVLNKIDPTREQKKKSKKKVKKQYQIL